ncbi:cupin domain-containing protein [Nocardioides sp. MAHUQ-72]|uniref:AraC family transcriptional regulator n=1 Tax=unclassified Nocardioides TaxID=2615069 RepID=UPI0036144BE0
MDVVGALLDGPRARRAFVLKAVFDGTWSLTVEDRAPLTVVVMARGRATFTGGRGPAEVGAGDVVVVRGPAPYTFADSATTAADIRILPGQVCVDPDGRLLADEMELGVRTWGNSRSADATVMLIGTYEQETSVGSLLLSRLPTELVIHDLDPAFIELFAAEVVGEQPGQAAVLDRLVDLLVVRCARSLLAESSAGQDALVEHALRAIEEHPEHPWTVESLAAHVGLSRAALARRFALRVGEPPLTYLTRWRLALAADLLVGTDQTLATIASRVGYANAFALSAAFKRIHGESPRDYRRRHVA